MKPTRKQNRLENFDYSDAGVYFITFCTNDRKQILSRIDAAADALSLPSVHLTETGKIVSAVISAIPEHYPGVLVDRFVIMPNHVHLLLRINPCGRLMSAPTGEKRHSVADIVRNCKAYVTRQLGFSIWQKGFYDHIIRDEQDYLTRAQYIDNNPAKWAEDEYNKSNRMQNKYNERLQRF